MARWTLELQVLHYVGKNVVFKMFILRTRVMWCTWRASIHIAFSILYQIKSVIDRDGATCRNNNHFARPTILYAP